MQSRFRRQLFRLAKEFMSREFNIGPLPENLNLGAQELHSYYNIACFPNPKEVPPDDSSEPLRINTKRIFLGAPASLPYAITRAWS